MATDERIRDLKLQYRINIEGAKISAISSGQIYIKWISHKRRNIPFQSH